MKTVELSRYSALAVPGDSFAVGVVGGTQPGVLRVLEEPDHTGGLVDP
jgi:hypothetical protein